jgi:hypothetical protein
MNPLIQLKQTTLLFLIALLLACFGLLPRAQAVVPAPDGGYPGGNTAEGQAALLSLTTGGFNTAVGLFSLRSDTTGGLNTALGAGTLLANTSSENTATGAGTLLSNTTGSSNTGNGAFALFSNSTGNFNTAVGDRALFNNTGDDNTAIGNGALFQNTTGLGNIALGVNAGFAVTTAGNVISIGIPGGNVTNSCFIGNIRAVTTANNNAIPVLVDSSGQLGTASSSRRFKKDIKRMDTASQAILALKPVTFHYKSDNTNRPEFGLIAEEVAGVNPDLVIYDADGKPYTVRYEAVNAMLLNEFLKEHKKGEQQDRKIEELEATVAKLEAVLKQQAAQIQRVSAQIEMSKPAPHVVANNH